MCSSCKSFIALTRKPQGEESTHGEFQVQIQVPDPSMTMRSSMRHKTFFFYFFLCNRVLRVLRESIWCQMMEECRHLSDRHLGKKQCWLHLLYSFLHHFPSALAPWHLHMRFHLLLLCFFSTKSPCVSQSLNSWHPAILRSGLPRIWDYRNVLLYSVYI